MGFAMISTTLLFLCTSMLPAESAKPSCVWTATPPVIDGKMDDACWKNASTISNFHMPWLGKKDRPAKATTSARLAWDRDYFYFFAQMEDSDLFADIKEHDGNTWHNDVFEIFLKPSKDHAGYYEFQVNAANTVFDCFFPKKSMTDFDSLKKKDRFHVESRVILDGTLNQRDDTDKGWSVEGRIPWTDFARTGGRPAANEVWKFALCRYDYNIKNKEPELSTSAPLASKPTPDFHLVQDYDDLLFEGPQAAWKSGTRLPQNQKVFQATPEPPAPFKTVNAFPKLSLKQPVSVVFQPGTNLLLASVQEKPYQPCSIIRFEAKADVELTQKLLETKDNIYDMTFHPKFLENGYLYVGCNGANADGKKYSRVVRYTMETKAPHNLNVDSRLVVIEWLSDGHNGSAVAFGKDSMLYVTTGDGTSDSDTWLSGQDLSRPLGKVLRIDVDHPDDGKNYSIPKDNPFFGQKDVTWETWAYGLRNPWRMHCDAKTGDIWVGNNGQDLWEQVYLVKKGDNFGWSVMEGSHPFYANRKAGPTPFSKPAAEHHHSEARSLTGGIVYHGAKHPELTGHYIYGDYSTGKVWAVRHRAGKVSTPKEIADTSHQIVCFLQDADGDLFVVDHGGTINRFVPYQAPAGLSPFPKKLSDTGLFASVKGHVTRPELIPYSVNAPFWSDGANKFRFISLPGTDDKGNPATIDYTNTRGWNFPNGTVIVKSFSLPEDEAKSSDQRWIETRLMVRTDNEWAGYSYLWNKEQTEAHLVDKEGADKEFEVRNKDGSTRKQVWRYPSRAECMVCHTRAANFVLGLCELQMNKQHDYPAGRQNQLECLEALGVLKINPGNEYKDAVRVRAGADGLKDKELDAFVNGVMNTSEQRKAPASNKMFYESPLKRKHLVNPYDKTMDLNDRAKSFLHSNCSSCHVEAGGGNAQMNLEFLAKSDKVKIIDEKPHHHTLDLPDARLVAPGEPDRSVLLKRISIVGQGQMPQIGRNRVDQEAVEMIRDWIRSIPK